MFVLDVSSSMSARNGQRLTRATSELIGSINQLTAEQDFSVILYSNHALPMFLKNNEAVMRQATPSNKQAALTWLRYQVRPQGGTMPARALQIAGNLKPDAVFFLSDGEFLYGHTADFNSPLNSFFQSFGQARKAMPPPGDVMLDPKSFHPFRPPSFRDGWAMRASETECDITDMTRSPCTSKSTYQKENVLLLGVCRCTLCELCSEYTHHHTADEAVLHDQAGTIGDESIRGYVDRRCIEEGDVRRTRCPDQLLGDK